MKLLKNLFLLGLLSLVGLFAFYQTFRLRADEELLAKIQTIHPGMPSAEVRALMQRDPVIYSPEILQRWIHKKIPQKNQGECWLFFMGYPSRNLVVYIDEKQTVGFTSWINT